MHGTRLMDRTLFVWLFLSGALAGVGRYLLSDRPGWQVAIGRAVSSGVLGMAAAASLVCCQNIPQEALVGIAAALGSLGTSGFERVVKHYFK